MKLETKYKLKWLTIQLGIFLIIFLPLEFLIIMPLLVETLDTTVISWNYLSQNQGMHAVDLSVMMIFVYVIALIYGSGAIISEAQEYFWDKLKLPNITIRKFKLVQVVKKFEYN